jgi:tetratricopeptide (TPR) repeat protein
VALVSVGSLAAAAMVAWLLLPSTDPIARLGRVGSAPRFEGLPVRAEPDSLTVLEDRAMAAYAARDYRRAAVLLDSASAAHHGPAVPFFLGIARLKTGFARDALEALGRALEPPRNPYVAEARLYRAKAWLALLQADSALAELARVPADAGATLVHAQALADSVREALRR